MVKKLFSIFIVVTLFFSVFLTFSVNSVVKADGKERVKIGDSALFINEQPEYKPYIRDEFGVFGSGWSYTIYGSYSEGKIRFSHEDFEKLTVGDFAQTGVGDFTNEKVAPFVTYYWQPETVGEPDTNFIAVSLMNEDNTDLESKFLSFCFEPNGKAVFIQYNGQVQYADNNGVMEPVAQNGYVTDFAPRLNINSFFEGHSALPYNVLRLYVDYQANKFYMANGEDASLANGKLFEFDVDWSLCEDLSLVRVIPYTVENITGGFSFMVKELMGNPIENAYAVPYGNIAAKYVSGSFLKPPKCEIMVNDNDHIADVSLKNGDSEISMGADGVFTLAETGNYTLTYYYETIDKIYIKDYSFSVVEKTVVNVKAPEPSFTEGNINDGLPKLNGETLGGVYRWKAGQTVKEGVNSYEWEFVPLVTDEIVEYKDAQGVIELAFSQNHAGGCGGAIYSSHLLFVLFTVVAIAFTLKRKINK